MCWVILLAIVVACSSLHHDSAAKAKDLAIDLKLHAGTAGEFSESVYHPYFDFSFDECLANQNEGVFEEQLNSLGAEMNGNSGNKGIPSSFCFHSKKKQQPVKSISLQTRHDLPVWWWKRWNGSDTSEYEAWALPTLHGCNVIGRVRKGREGRVW